MSARRDQGSPGALSAKGASRSGNGPRRRGGRGRVKGGRGARPLWAGSRVARRRAAAGQRRRCGRAPPPRGGDGGHGGPGPAGWRLPMTCTRQMAQVSHSTSQLHMATAFHFFSENILSGPPALEAEEPGCEWGAPGSSPSSTSAMAEGRGRGRGAWRRGYSATWRPPELRAGRAHARERPSARLRRASATASGSGGPACFPTARTGTAPPGQYHNTTSVLRGEITNVQCLKAKS